jgi:hypothetical protein
MKLSQVSEACAGYEFGVEGKPGQSESKWLNKGEIGGIRKSTIIDKVVLEIADRA